ncbi:hypothetical protein AB0758_30910 [Tolypothrix bouteillei VB521301_2]
MALPKIKSKFDGAVQKSSQEQKIAELQAEVEQLRASSISRLGSRITKT